MSMLYEGATADPDVPPVYLTTDLVAPASRTLLMTI